MSYILDALRRADAERERGAVPGLHAQSDVADLEPAPRDRKPLLLAAAGGGALILAVAIVLVVAPWRGTPATGERVAAAGDSVGAQAQQTTAPAPQNFGAPAAPAVAPNPALAAQAQDTAARRAAVDTPAPDYANEPPSAHRSAGAMPTDRPAPPRTPPARATAEGANPNPGGRGTTPDANVPPAPGAQAQPQPVPEVVEHYGPPLPNKAAPAAAAPAAPIVKLNDLPPTLRAQMPHLAVGGAIYSDVPSGRMLILNGQVYHEGDHPAPDTLLEQIHLKSAVLNYRGTRYEITY
jgi:general secretion pathway protein B